ncbi:hypothetical protein EV182_001293 [Spiromyces aspiralis]|uniref:Uncharacterized protein n=1 Tax=Spiromyces aspiralis TaxID=68401 RepID=A0ACC1HM81_9FUNG|nr:hypothetical protein EV182_001293 [Spiromyces aspiralis]
MSENAPTGHGGAALDGDYARIPWSIDTKYYTAEVEFWVDSTDHLSQDTTDGEEQDTMTTDELHKSLADLVDAVIVVYDPAWPDTFQDIYVWERFAAKYDPDIKICFAWHAGASSKPEGLEGEIDRAEQWCLEHGWELVVDAGLEPYDQEENSIDRIRDALINKTWGTMVSKKGDNGRELQTDESHTMSIAALLQSFDAEFEDDENRPSDHEIQTAHDMLVSARGGSDQGATSPAVQVDNLIHDAERIRKYREYVASLGDEKHRKRMAAAAAIVLGRYFVSD